MAVNAKYYAREANSVPLEFQLYSVYTDETKTKMSKSAITSAQLTLRDDETGAVINGRENLDVLDKIDATGLFHMALTPEDNVIVTATKDEEIHVATVTIVWTSADGQMTTKDEVNIHVRNLKFTA